MERFGPYVLVDHLGRGGLGDIFRAKLLGAGGFERWVAVKMLRPEHAIHAERVQRFIDEARLAARCTHGNIAQVFTLERFGDHWALVLELVDGLDLLRLVRALAQYERRLGLDEAVHVAKEALLALDFVHRLADERGVPLGLMHGDIAPANLMIARTGELKLIDFGLTRQILELEPSLRGGKLRYRAPEQVQGDGDARSDLYAIALVLWELIAGERIYEGLGLEEIVAEVSAGSVPDLSLYRDDVPAALIDVLRCALAVEPKRRFQDAAAFLRALDSLPIGKEPLRSRRALAEVVTVLSTPTPSGSQRPAVAIVEQTLESALEDALLR